MSIELEAPKHLGFDAIEEPIGNSSSMARHAAHAKPSPDGR
jgi:hypothetical protein